MADRTVAPGDALALEARPLLPPPTRPRRVKDERSDADSVPDAPWPLVPGDDPLYPVYTAATDAPWSLVPGDDPLYPVYTPTVPQSPVHDETHREFASELLVHLRDAFRDRPHTLASDVNLYYEDAHPPPGRAPGQQPASIAPDFMLFLRTIEASPYRSYRTWEVGAPAWVLEILSYRTWEDDVGDKWDLYARLGVTEYWFYDPEGVQHPDAAGTLRGFRLRAGIYEAIAPPAARGGRGGRDGVSQRGSGRRLGRGSAAAPASVRRGPASMVPDRERGASRSPGGAGRPPASRNPGPGGTGRPPASRSAFAGTLSAFTDV